MSKLKSSINFIGIGLLIFGTHAYAACTPNVTNASNSSTTTLASSRAGDCVENSGRIMTTLFGFSGILSSAVNTININSGTITTLGSASSGILVYGSETTSINIGLISISGFDSKGIFSTRRNSININSGTILTTGSLSYGLYAFESYSENYNAGAITTTGGDSAALYTVSGSSYNINNGIIVTRGSGSEGLISYGSNTVNINNGNILTSGTNSHGILSLGADSTITNTGTIITTGYQAHGVALGGDNSTFNSFGLVKATGESAYAINWRLGGSNGVVNLNRGSVIIGDIVAGDHENARLNINFGSGVSYAYSVSSNVLVSDLDNRPMVTGSAYAAGIGAQETAAEMLYQRTSVVNSALDRRLRAYASDDAESQPYWLDVYYSDVTRNSGGNFSTQTAFYNHSYGINAGYKLPVQFTPLELVVNVEQSNLNIDSGNQKIDSSSIMAGFLAPSITEVFGAKLSAKALVGYADHDGDRKVMTNSLLYNGSRQIKSDYNSTYAVLGTALTKLYPITDRLTADVILGIDLNIQRFESYKESDYFAWDSRTLTQLHSKVQTGLDYKLWGDKGSVFARVGAEHRDLIGGATQDYSINGTNVSFNTNNKNDTYLTAQVGVRAQLEKRVHLFGVVNTLHSSDSVNSVSGNIGLRANF